MTDFTREKLEKSDDLIRDVISQFNSVDIFKNMDTETFVLIKSLIGLYEIEKEIRLKQSEIIDSQNKKLDDILQTLEARNAWTKAAGVE